MSNEVPSKEEFREVGFTADAINYPLSEKAYQWLLMFNGTPEGYKVPRAWKFAPNKTMLDYLEKKALEEESRSNSS